MIRRKSGFSLIEVIVVAALVAVAALLMYSFFGQGFSLYTVESDSADEQMNLRQVVSEITNNARVTDVANIKVNSGVLTVGSDAYKLQNKKIMRNGTAIATGIKTFSVTKNSDNILTILIVNTKETRLETSLSLVSPTGTP